MSENVVYKFENYRLVVHKRLLWRDEEIVPLTRKTVETLIVLIENRGLIVDKENLMERVWADSFVEENNLNQCISALRKAFTDDLRSPRFIETVPRRGYRFIAEVSDNINEPPVLPAAGHEYQTKSLAVLPFKYFGSDSDTDYLGLGMADTLITRLSHIHNLNVRPTSSILPFNKPHQNPVNAGRELQVEKVLEGSIRRLGERIRVTVQLVDVADGKTFWAEKFDETAQDVFLVEDSIAEKLTSALTLQLTSEEKSLLNKHYAGNVTAYHSYLKGRYFSNLLTREGFHNAQKAFERATAHDPAYALAFEGSAYNYVQALDLHFPPAVAMPKAKELVTKALELDEDLAQAHSTLGSIYFWYDWNWELAESEFLRALELNPKMPASLRIYAWFLVFMQRFDEAFELFRQAEKLDPFSFENMLYTIPSFYFARKYEEAVVHTAQALKTYPDFWLGHVMLGRSFEEQSEIEKSISEYETALRLAAVPEIYGDLGRAYGLAGKNDKARQIIKQLKEKANEQHIAPFNFAMIYLGMGDLEKTFEWLESSFTQRSWYLTWLKVAPVFDGLRDDRRFISLIQRVGI